MRRRRPDLLKLLFQPLATDRRGEVPEGQKPYFEIPVFNWHKGFLTAIYQRQYIDSAQRFPEAPRHTPELVEALVGLHRVSSGSEETVLWVAEGVPTPVRLLQRENGQDTYDLRLVEYRGVP